MEEINRRYQNLLNIKSATTPEYLQATTVEDLNRRIAETETDVKYIIDNWATIRSTDVPDDAKFAWTTRVQDATQLREDIKNLICPKIRECEQGKSGGAAGASPKQTMTPQEKAESKQLADTELEAVNSLIDQVNLELNSITLDFMQSATAQELENKITGIQQLYKEMSSRSKLIPAGHLTIKEAIEQAAVLQKKRTELKCAWSLKEKELNKQLLLLTIKKHTDQMEAEKEANQKEILKLKRKLRQTEEKGQSLTMMSDEEDDNNSSNEKKDKPVVQLKLDKINLPYFSGDLTEWTQFKEFFTYLIHNNNELSDIVKFHQLRSHLKGTAFDTIRGYQLAAENYKAAWDDLKKRFDRKGEITNEYIRKFLEVPAIINRAIFTRQRAIVDAVNQMLRALPSLGVPVADWDPFVMFITITKLDEDTRADWKQFIGRKDDLKVTDLIEFLETKAIEVHPTQSEKLSQVLRGNIGKRVETKKIFQVQENRNQEQPKKLKCLICGGNHRFWHCDHFKKETAMAKTELVKSFKACFKCFLQHQFGVCDKENCSYCGGPHNVLLCFKKENDIRNLKAPPKRWNKPKLSESEKKVHIVEKAKSENPAPAGAESDWSDTENWGSSSTKKKPQKLINEIVKSSSNVKGENDQVILGTAKILVKGNSEFELKIKALCDNGSQVNLITQSVIQQLREKPNSEQTTFTGIGGKALGSSLGEIYLQLKLRNGDYLNEKFYVVKKITNYTPKETMSKWDHIREELADNQHTKPGKVNALLGVGIWIQIIEPEILHSQNNLSIAQKTKLGYVIFQREKDPYSSMSPYIGAINKGPSIKDLLNQIKRLWEIEEISAKHRRSEEEEMCEKIFQNEHSRDKFGRYIVRMPFNNMIEKLGKSKRIALRQFFAMEHRMKRNAEFCNKYKVFMSEYETLGHMEPIFENQESGYYTPHHGIISANKFRIVFNASAKTTTGISLNECQMIGEKLQLDLHIILMNFRKHRYGVIGDIEKMYRQVAIHPNDQMYQKILWRSNEKEPIQVYKLKTVTYGQTCAPHCAIRALVQCAVDHEQQYPRAAILVKNCFYVDDLLTGGDSLQEVNEIKQEVTAILKLGQFNITKWKTNGLFDGNIEIQDKDEPSVLGLHWNLKRDKFFYKIKEDKVNLNSNIWTKRKILSRIGKMYDPNGYLGPVLMKGKIIIQDLWRDKLDWDEEVIGNVKDTWESFNKDLENVHLISIDRWLGTLKQDKIELHGFCDASEKGFGCVIFVRTKLNNDFHTQILVSKSRVAPLKVVSIPRLELCAASLLMNLMEVIHPIFSLNVRKIYCWTDSQIVLHWLSKSSSDLKTFVANRVANIQTITTNLNIDWNWIAGPQNPADLISRGTTVLDLHKENIWWHGPNWLQEPKQNWPIQPQLVPIRDNEEFHKELKSIHFLIENEPNELHKGKWYKFDQNRQKQFPLLEAYGDWKRLVRVTATVLRAVQNFRNINEKRVGYLISSEIESAQNYLIKIDQSRTFPKERDLAKRNTKTLLNNLVVIWDRDFEFIRIDGRIQGQHLTRDEQFPIVIGREGILASLLIRDAHQQTKHGGNQLTLQYLREKYWIINAKRLIKSVIRKCPICVKLRLNTSEQLMASLPTYRTEPMRAFTNIGIDYAGPVIIRSELGRLPKLSKAWIAVFVCLVTRAIHLELVSDASTQAFVAALKRMMARRGKVNLIISDNATNFVGANNYLKAIIEQIEKVLGNLQTEFNLTWKFMTPGAPHQGGIYEAAVKSVKHHLIRVIGETTLTFEEYVTILNQVEACVNSRPLHALNDDPTSLNALTPGHFLIGEALVRIPDEQDFKEVPSNRLTRWNHLQKMVQHFWDRWHKEYLRTLVNRTKWLVEKQNLNVGDLVIVKEDNIAPLKWKLGRIQEVLPGKDGLVRNVIVRTASGVYKRPIVKLGILFPADKELE